MPFKISIRKISALFLVLPFVSSGFSQNILKGKVIDENTGEPIASASVYLSNTSVGTQTNAEGKFFIQKLPAGNLVLVVSSIGYKISETNLPTTKRPQELVIRISHKTTELNEVVVSPYEKNGWKIWGDLFIENFIGTSFFAHNCKILNHEVLKFRMRRRDSTLLVHADEPLIIENNSLGYELHFDLKKFELTLLDSGNSLTYSGHPFFKEFLPKNEKEEERFKENRRKAYSLSLMRFMRSLFFQNADEDFKIQQRNLGRITDVSLAGNKHNASAAFPESIADTIYEIGSDLVNIKIIKTGSNNAEVTATGDQNFSDHIFSFSDQQVSMYFSGALVISINKVNAPSEYFRFLGKTYSPIALLSEFELKKNELIHIYIDGNYAESTNLKINGFWAWWEKLATMLPLDYTPAD
jgi:hypothetical protein